MSNSTSSDEVKKELTGYPEFYLLKIADRLSAPYHLNSLDAVLFLDSLTAAGWTTHNITEKTVIITAPADSNIALFMARSVAA